jgi:hypothetical protein
MRLPPNQTSKYRREAARHLLLPFQVPTATLAFCQYLLNTIQTVFAPFLLLYHHHSIPYSCRSSISHQASIPSSPIPISTTTSVHNSSSTATHHEDHSSSHRRHRLGLCCAGCNRRQELDVGASCCSSPGQHSRQQLVFILLPPYHIAINNHLPPAGTSAATRTTRTSALTSRVPLPRSNLAATTTRRPFTRCTTLRLPAFRTTCPTLHQHTPLIFRTCTRLLRTYTRHLCMSTKLLRICTRRLRMCTQLLLPQYTPRLLHQNTHLLHSVANQASQASLLDHPCATSSSRSVSIVSSIQMSAR